MRLQAPGGGRGTRGVVRQVIAAHFDAGRAAIRGSGAAHVRRSNDRGSIGFAPPIDGARGSSGLYIACQEVPRSTLARQKRC